MQVFKTYSSDLISKLSYANESVLSVARANEKSKLFPYCQVARDCIMRLEYNIEDVWAKT